MALVLVIKTHPYSQVIKSKEKNGDKTSKKDRTNQLTFLATSHEFNRE